jgi:sirohydrochlorin ferrochelatase
MRNEMTQVLLCDNGSRQPAATLVLREIAQQLSVVAKQPVAAVSLQHSDSIDASLLNGLAAQTLPGYLSQQIQQGERDFIILPLFFGKSRALSSFIPQQINSLQQQYGDFTLRVAEVLYPMPDGDPALVQILYDNIQQCQLQNSAAVKQVVLVDHGSPVPTVTDVRKSIASQLVQLLDDDISLSQAVMERRPGKEYDFNGDLLEDCLLDMAEQGMSGAMVSMMFLLPGRHAGENGDVNEICARVMQRYPDFRVWISPLISEHPLLIDILSRRLQNIS